MNNEMMRFLISVEVQVTDPVAVRAAGVSSVVDTEGQPVDPYVPDGDFGLNSEISQAMMGAAMVALRDREGVTPVVASLVKAQTAQGGGYPEVTLPAMPASGS